MISYSEKSSLVNWTAFEIKSDRPERDFEALCRSLVRLAFSGDGEFVGYKQQAGVEFLIKVERENSTLGSQGSTVGWQCKYFRNKKLSSAQFAKVQDSYQKALKYYPNVSTWIVWTPECLSKSDQWKIKKLRAQNHTVKKILFWHDDMILALSAILPRTTFLQSYFGQYSFSRKDLNDALEDSIVPVRGRWKQSVHCVSNAEKFVRRALFEDEFWDDAKVIDTELKRLNSALVECEKIDGLQALCEESIEFERRYSEILDAVKDGRVVDAKIKGIPSYSIETIPAVFRAALSKQNRASLLLWNLRHYIKQPARVYKEIRDLLFEPLIAVKASPGMGKTHLCLSVVSPTERRPAGIFLLGRCLRKGCTIDEFVRSQSFAGRTFENLDTLLNALDSSGRKHGCIMPLVIDGLNEAESPEEWADKLMLIRAKIKRTYPNVKVLVTYRCPEMQESARYIYRPQKRDNKVVELDYEKMCLPNGIKVVQIEPENLNEMARRYFRLYNIDFKGRRLDLQGTAVNHPLLLSIFCDANNGKQVSDVDLHNARNVFPNWLEVIKTRICVEPSVRGRHSKDEFEKAIDCFARLLWEQGGRSVSADSLDKELRCIDADWLHKWSTILADEGLAMRYHTYGVGGSRLEGIHDRISGYIIARYLKRRCNDFQNVFEMVEEQEHHLETDIVEALVPMWMEEYPDKDILSAIPERVIPWAIEHILSSPARHCPIATKKSMWNLDTTSQHVNSVRGDILRAAVWQCMEGGKAFNGQVLDLYLSNMGMANRDALWGGWVYNKANLIYEQLKFVYANRDKIGLDDVQSVFTCCKWLFSSNVPPIRDLATKLMCLLGEKYPNVVLDLIVLSFGVNDLYILERLLASAYGICIYLKNLNFSDKTQELVSKYAKDVKEKILKKRALFATSHYGVLNYAINTVALVSGNKTRKIEVYTNPFKPCASVSAEDLQKSTFATLGDIDFIYKDLSYIVGGHDYQTDTPQYLQAYDLIQKRIFVLGYRNELFEQYDRTIRDERFRPFRNGEVFARRFGKKYASIAFMELKGCLDEKVTCWDRWHEVSIDPTFPEKPLEYPFSGDVPLIKRPFKSMRRWIYEGFVPNVSQFTVKKGLADSLSEFILVDGYVAEEDKHGRRIFVSLDGLLVPKEEIGVVRKSYCDARIIHPHFYYAFHGESPWSLNWYKAELGCKDSRVDLRPELVRDGTFINSCRESIPVELITVRYNWESYHSVQNDVGGCLLSANMAQCLGLRLTPHKWEYVDGEGQLAARYYSSQTDARTIEMLYVRKDLLELYTKMSGKVFLMGYWGERQISYKKHDKYISVYKRLQSGYMKFSGFVDPISSKGG